MKSLFLKTFSTLVIASMALTACIAPNTGVVVPSPTPIVATSAAQQSDDVWDRIQANHKIVVGTSWDYPPFSSVSPNFQVVGLDIALIEEVGRRLQIPVEIQNHAFEGLPDALQINQIDIAVAAIALTPERLNQLSFSPIYYVNQTAVLARNDALVPVITDFNQLAKFRVGVRRGTVYEQMAQSLLVNTGLMGSDKLLSYTQTDESVRDLLENRVDVVLLGEATASYYGDQQNLHVVGNGFHEQNLAIAMRSGTPRLNAEITRVMDEMLTDGTVLSLIQSYIQSDVTALLSTPIPSLPVPVLPVVTAVPAACVDGMKFVADVSYGDNNMKNPPFVKPGEVFVKTWRVQNTGSCVWTPSYRLVYAYGNVTAAKMGGQPLNIPGDVAPGQTVDLSVALVAPIDPLTYQGFWQVVNERGALFGQAIWVAVSTLEDQDNPVIVGQPSANYCSAVVTAPKNPIIVLSDFDAVWTVQNISGGEWSSDSVDYKFISGTAMHKKDAYDFTQTVQDGESIKLVVAMTAPADPGVYSVRWAVVSGSKTLCVLTTTITVTPK